MIRAIAIILAAGFSTRMGQCKASLPWHNGTTLLTYQIEQFHQAGVAPIVVLGAHNAHQQEQCPPDCTVAINPDAAQGKVSSILTGLNLLPDDWDAVFISAVDQPRPAGVYQEMLAAFEQGRSLITIPVWGTAPEEKLRQKAGHPPLFSRALLPDLLAIRDETLGLRNVIQTHRSAVDYLALPSPSIVLDLNTPNLYEKAFIHSQENVWKLFERKH